MLQLIIKQNSISQMEGVRYARILYHLDFEEGLLIIYSENVDLHINVYYD